MKNRINVAALSALAHSIAAQPAAKRLGAMAAILGVSTGKVMAAVPAAVTTAITETGTDLTTTVTAVIVAFIAFWGLRKLAQKFGWM